MSEKWKTWWKAAGLRAVKTMAQSALGVIGAAAVFGDVNWPVVGSAALLAGIISLLTSVEGLPELQTGAVVVQGGEVTAAAENTSDAA